MRTLFFGASNRKLLGVYHPPSPSATPPRSEGGVLLCYPGVQEYNVTHGAFRKLAVSLARAGVPVLRFDYFGTGDSSGDVVDGSPDGWIEDIHTAVAELEELSSVRGVSIVGFRLGAALAARAVSEGLSVSQLVLWDPVVSGRDYVSELEARDRQQNIVLLHEPAGGPGRQDELLGYPFPEKLRSALGQIDLLKLKWTAAKRLVLMVTEERKRYRELRSAMRSATEGEPEFQFRFVPEDAGTTNLGARENVLLASKVPAAIKEMIAGRAP